MEAEVIKAMPRSSRIKRVAIFVALGLWLADETHRILALSLYGPKPVPPHGSVGAPRNSE